MLECAASPGSKHSTDLYDLIVLMFEPRGMGALKMPEKRPRCPYCVVGGEFHLMSPLTGDRLMCQQCGHITFPGDPVFRCPCAKCLKIDSSFKGRITGRV